MKGLFKKNKEISLLAVALLVLAGLFLYFRNNKKVGGKRVTVEDIYSVEIPSGWNYQISNDGNTLVVSDYKGQLNFVDRSSAEENARVKVTVIEKDGDMTADSFIQGIVDSFEQEEVVVNETTLDSMPATKISLKSRSTEYLVLDQETYILYILSTSYENPESDYADEINQTIDSIDILQ